MHDSRNVEGPNSAMPDDMSLSFDKSAVMVASSNNWNLLKQARRGVLTL